MPDLPGKSILSAQTKAVMTYEDNVNPVPILDGDQRRGGKGKIIGIRAWLKMRGGNAAAMRESGVPNSLSDSKYPWTKESSSNRRKAYRR